VTALRQRSSPGRPDALRELVAAIGCTLLLAGCVDLGPPPPTATRPRSKLAQAQATHEYPSPPPPRQTAAGAPPTPRQAIHRFATAYINWTAPTVAADERALAAQSIGQARSAMTLAAAQTAQDYELRRGGIANRGTVEAIAPLLGARNRYVVVTRELTSATNTTAYQGLGAGWHLAIATVTQLSPGRWVLSDWQPES
jgi:hypothetical protein